MKLMSYSVEIHHGEGCECTPEQLKEYTDSLPSEEEVANALHVILRTRPELLDADTTIRVYEATEYVA